jgi:hypothetical protein
MHLSVPNSALGFRDLIQLAGNVNGVLLAAGCQIASDILHQHEVVTANITDSVLSHELRSNIRRTEWIRVGRKILGTGHIRIMRL